MDLFPTFPGFWLSTATNRGSRAQRLGELVYVFRKEGGGYKPYIGYLDISVPTRRKKEKKRGCMRQLGCCWFDGVGSCAPLDKGTRGFESGTGTGTGILNIRE
jgi:hypothetical protein